MKIWKMNQAWLLFLVTVLCVGAIRANAQEPGMAQAARPGTPQGQNPPAQGAAAQDPASPQSQPPGRKITVQEAFQIAERQNLDLVAARLRHAVAQAGITIAGERPNPTVSFGATRDTPHESLFFDQPLELGGKRARRIDLAKEQVTLTDIEVSTVERQVHHDVRQAFYAASLARAFAAQQRDIAALTHRLHDIAQARFTAGDIPELEVLQAELEMSRADADVEVAQQEQRVAASKLSAMLNEPANADWEPTPGLDIPPPAIAMEDAIQRAASANPELQHLAQETRIELANARHLRADRFPEVTVEAGADFNSPPDFETGGRGQLTVGLPIFSRNQGELAQSDANLRALEGETEATRRSVAGDVQAAYYELVAKQTQVALYRDKLIPAGRRLESLAEESYRAGRTSILEVIAAQRDVQQNEHDYLQSLFDLQQAFADLEQIVGVNLD
jgi:cobalt-zinc-cadmium efflux system outer membrane protein